jgi:catechol 2,3-dioxygenase-like lactoylglutathione lyase family enzyme
MRLNHIGLPVREEARSLAFYATYLGFDPATARADTRTARWSFATPTTSTSRCTQATFSTGGAAFLHFGFSASEPDLLRELMASMRADGVSIVEQDEEPDIVSFKCIDPDGWRVEVYWEQV